MKIQDIYYENEKIQVRIISSRSYRNLKLSVHKGYIRMSKPAYVSYKEAQIFIDKNMDEIYRMYAEYNDQKLDINSLEFILWGGKKLKLKVQKITDKKCRLQIFDDYVLYEVDSTLTDEEKLKMFKILFKKVLKQKTNTLLKERLQFWCKKMDETYNKFTIKCQKTVWGSAVKQKRNLNFNMKLAMLPLDVFDYIVVHELCHFKEANHSFKFWNLVAKYIPNYKEKIVYLKSNYDCFDIV